MKSTTKQTFKFYLTYMNKYKRFGLTVFFGIFIGVLADVCLPLVIKHIIDYMALGAAHVEIAGFYSFFIQLIILYIIGLFGWRIANYSILYFEAYIMEDIANDCFIAINKHSFNFFNNEFVGSLVKRINRMIRSFENFFDIIAYELFTIFIRVTLSVIVLFTINIWIALIMFIWAILFVWINFILAKYKMKKYDIKRARIESKTTAALADAISNNMNIKFFSTRQHEAKLYKNVLQKWKEIALDAWRFSAHLEAGQHFSMIILELLMLIIMVNLWIKGSVTIGDFVLLQSYLASIFIFIWGLGRNIRRLYTAFADAEEMTVILNTPIEIKDEKNAKDIKVAKGKVEFKNVSFKYKDGEKVMENFNLTVNAGEKVALIGPSGGGKTTFVKLLMRLFDINKGEIYIDQQNIAKAKQDSLRSKIALVPQDPVLFHRSLMENIRYGNINASDEEVIKASKLANCHDFIKKLHKKYDTFVGERGVKLSGGERQRIAIARAILSNAKILIFDEATSNLDVASEKLIQGAMHNLIKDKTTIIIAHRLSTVKNVDRIIVIKDGEIKEYGTHDKLIKSKGLYSKLWDLYIEGNS